MPVKYHNIENTPDVLNQVISNWRYRQRMGFVLVSGMWKDLVGETVAQHAKPLQFKRGVLTLAVDSSVWMSELQFHIPMILERFSEKLGAGKVNRITFQVMDLETLELPREQRQVLPELDDLDEQRVREVVASVRDDQLKSAVEAAYRTSLRLRKLDAERKAEALAGKSVSEFLDDQKGNG